MPVTRRALYVTPFALLPRTEGHRKRMAMTFDRLVDNGFLVDVLFISREYDWSSLYNEDMFRDLQSMGNAFHFVHAATPGAPQSKFFEVDEWWPPQADDYCRWLFDNNGYEIVFCNYIFMTKVFELCDRSVVKLLDTHDLFADRQKLLASHGLPAEFFYTNRKNEGVGLDRADIAIAIKDEEANYFRNITDADVITLPYVEPTFERPYGIRPRGGEGPTRFGFFGSRNSINVRNVVEFIKFLRAQEPAEGYPFEFWLYGSLCTRMKGELPDYVRLGGMVRDVDEFYDNVDCVVNPQYFSTGLKIKIAEALAYGAPLIAHRHSFEGFGRPLDPAQDCKGFEGVLSAMLAVVGSKERLGEIETAAKGVQHRQVLDCDHQWAKILTRAAAKGHWLYLLVNVDAFNRIRFYRHIVEMVFVTFAKSYRVTAVGDRDEAAPGAWRTFRRKANRFGHDLTPEQIEDEAIVIGFDDPGRWAPFARGGRLALFFEDAARMASGGDASRDPASFDYSTARWTVVRGKGAPPMPGDPATVMLVDYFRWLPWDMSVVATGDQYDLASEVWVLTDSSVRAAWTMLFERMFAGRRMRRFSETPLEGVAGGAAALMDLVFGQKQYPELVICLTRDPAFTAMKAWFAANGIVVREIAHYAADQEGAAPGPEQLLRMPKLSELVRLPDRAKPVEVVSSAWLGSGWRSLSDLMRDWSEAA